MVWCLVKHRYNCEHEYEHDNKYGEEEDGGK
jgi:hypothetical protein